jgi:hypothetical protein
MEQLEILEISWELDWIFMTLDRTKFYGLLFLVISIDCLSFADEKAKTKNPVIPSFNSCSVPFQVEVNESDRIFSQSTENNLKFMIEELGHRTIKSEDLLRERKSLEANSYVYRRNTLLSLALYDQKAAHLKFPMTHKEFKQVNVYNEKSQILIINKPYLNEALAKLKDLDFRRMTRRLNHGEEKIKISSLFDVNKLFVDDQELQNLSVTYVMAFTPYIVNPFFESRFKLDPGHGNESQNIVVGTTISAIEAKRRAMVFLDFTDETIESLGKPSEVSDIQNKIARMLLPLESADPVGSEEIEIFYRQFISLLPHCK